MIGPEHKRVICNEKYKQMVASQCSVSDIKSKKYLREY